jgi:hypothetical protein
MLPFRFVESTYKLGSTQQALRENEDCSFAGDRTFCRHIPQSRLENYASHCILYILCNQLEACMRGEFSIRDVFPRHFLAALVKRTKDISA